MKRILPIVAFLFLGIGTIEDPGSTDNDLTVARSNRLFGKTAKLVNVLSRRSLGWNSTSVLGDVCQYLDTSQNLLSVPDAGAVYYVRSTSASDTADSGVGSRTVRVVYLDSNWDQVTQTVNLLGTTPVALRYGDAGISAVQWMEVGEVGSNEVSVGDLTVSSKIGAGTPAVSETLEYIAAGGNRSLCGRYRIPRGYIGYLHEMECTSVGNATMDVRLRAQVFQDDFTKSGAFHFINNQYINSNLSAVSGLHWAPIPELSVLKISAVPSAAAAANRLDCGIHLMIVKK